VMPGGMSGTELVEKAVMLHPGIKVLYMSGYAPETMMRQGLNSRSLRLLQKPFRKSELAKTLRSVLAP